MSFILLNLVKRKGNYFGQCVVLVGFTEFFADKITDLLEKICTNDDVPVATVITGFSEEGMDVSEIRKDNIAGGQGTDRAIQIIWNERTKYYWQIKAQTEQGVVTSPVASFETGLSGFRAVCIGNDRDEEGKVLEFQKKFRVSGKITKARLYISGLGYFRGRLDGVFTG